MISTPSVVLVGELNPYGSPPYFALYDDPPGCAGARLRRFLGLDRETYLGESVVRINLCRGDWSAPRARIAASQISLAYSSVPIVILGRKVAAAFGKSGVLAFSRDGLVVCLPHPSGRCRVWSQPGSIDRARALLREVCPAVPWGTCVT